MKHLALILLALGLFACGSKKETKQTEENSKPVISVVNYPLYYFAQRIGGDLIDLKYPIPIDVDPAYWVPDSESLSIFQNSDILFTNGANYAKWLNNVSLPQRILVNTTDEVKEKYIEVQEGAAHSHGDGEMHVHTGLAFTTWLDFQIALAQARAVKKALVKLMPANERQLQQNYALLYNDIKSLDNKMKAIVTDQVIIGSHPVYQYLAAAYSLNIKSVHLEPGEEPSKKQWHDFDHFLEHYPSEVMLWEGEPLKITSELIEIKGLDVVVFNPCANQPAEGDFMSVMSRNIEILTTATTAN